ncbi:hypothetical protein L596_019788 [Steinernema carpocapsae]|uniref:Uncharacterized protein n=1 Tax=Steinernema carpocapsae TaxID=34508 RepID=A0A4U5MRK2_STECR|nr:hypothetical protein L596_019788 [Steinernema carpocapsae]
MMSVKIFYSISIETDTKAILEPTHLIAKNLFSFISSGLPTFDLSIAPALWRTISQTPCERDPSVLW